MIDQVLHQSCGASSKSSSRTMPALCGKQGHTSHYYSNSKVSHKQLGLVLKFEMKNKHPGIHVGTKQRILRTGKLEKSSDQVL